MHKYEKGSQLGTGAYGVSKILYDMNVKAINMLN